MSLLNEGYYVFRTLRKMCIKAVFHQPFAFSFPLTFSFFDRMRKLVVIFAVVCGIMGFDDESIKRVTIRCKESSGVDPELIMRAFQGDITEDVGLRRYFNCFFTEMNFQDDAGHLNFGRIRENLNSMMFRSDDPMAAVTVCEERNLAGSSDEDTIFMNLKCFLGII